VTANELVERVAALAGVRAPRLAPPKVLLQVAVGVLELYCRLRGKPAPITRDVLQVIGRYAWYDTAKARRELGWTPRPLQQTLQDTIAWLRNPRLDAPARAGVA
jgi:dihydroflavonol-4-reductase